MKLTTDQLHEAGAEVRHSVQPSEMQLRVVFRQVMQRVKLLAEATPEQIRQWLERLELVMAMCGTRTAAQALQYTAKGSPARSLELVTSENWEPFLENLTSIAVVMCGEPSAHLMRRNGQF